ncbi:MAG: DUF202 domain-containing protein [Phormidesmis sp.]
MPQPPNIDRQREHQANERTFLAWLRTSIALIGFGFAIARFGIFLKQISFVMKQPIAVNHPLFNSQSLGISLVVLGVVVIGLAAWRYGVTFRQIEQNNYRPNPWMVWTMTGVVMLLGILSIPILLIRAFDQPAARSPASRSLQSTPK